MTDLSRSTAMTIHRDQVRYMCVNAPDMQSVPLCYLHRQAAIHTYPGSYSGEETELSCLWCAETNVQAKQMERAVALYCQTEPEEEFDV